MGKSLRVIFMGSPDFAVPILSALQGACDIIAVYCQPPRRAGRGQTQRPCLCIGRVNRRG